MKEVHYFYKITNLINHKFYYGIRTCHCLPGQDSYMGSGTYLHKAFRKYGIQNFRKEVLRICKTRVDVSDLERWIVTEELVKDPMCYNIKVGGDDSDSFYGKVACIDVLTGKNLSISRSEFYKNPDRCQSTGKGLVTVRYKGTDSKGFKVTSSEYYSSRDLYEPVMKKNMSGKLIAFNTITNKNEEVYKNDLRFSSGELTYIWTGRTHSKETKNKISKASSERQKGSGNVMYGKTIINNGVKNKSIKLNELDEFLDKNPEWSKGKLFSEQGMRNISKKKYSLAVIHSFESLNCLNDLLSKLPNPKKLRYTNGSENIRISEINARYYELKGYWRGITQFNGHKNHNSNSGFKGYSWINNGSINKCIKSNELDEYLSSNEWIKGKIKRKGNR